MGSWFRKGALRDDKKKTATRETTTAFARLILDFSGMGTNGDLLSHFSKIQLVLNAAFWLIELPLGKKLFCWYFLPNSWVLQINNYSSSQNGLGVNRPFGLEEYLLIILSKTVVLAEDFQKRNTSKVEIRSDTVSDCSLLVFHDLL